MERTANKTLQISARRPPVYALLIFVTLAVWFLEFAEPDRHITTNDKWPPAGLDDDDLHPV